MNHEEWLERAEIYALGALDGEELSQFENHLARCRVCEGHVRETRELLITLPRSLTQVAPPTSIKQKLLDRIAAETVVPMRGRSQVRWLWWGAGSGALAAASVLIVLSWSLYQTRLELVRLRGQMTALQISFSQQDEIVKFLSGPQARLIPLSGLDPSPLAAAQLLWNPATRKGFLLTSGLPKNPAGKTYELWGIAGDEPVPAGVFSVDERGQALFPLPPLPEEKSFDKFAVTLEPAGGVPKPTGQMHLLGSL